MKAEPIGMIGPGFYEDNALDSDEDSDGDYESGGELLITVE